MYLKLPAHGAFSWNTSVPAKVLVKIMLATRVGKRSAKHWARNLCESRGVKVEMDQTIQTIQTIRGITCVSSAGDKVLSTQYSV